jgi:hypothetical protein
MSERASQERVSALAIPDVLYRSNRLTFIRLIARLRQIALMHGSQRRIRPEVYPGAGHDGPAELLWTDSAASERGGHQKQGGTTTHDVPHERSSEF